MTADKKINPLNRKAKGIQIFADNGYKFISASPLLMERTEDETKPVVMIWGSPFFPKFQDDELGFFNRLDRIKRAFHNNQK